MILNRFHRQNLPIYLGLVFLTLILVVIYSFSETSSIVVFMLFLITIFYLVSEVIGLKQGIYAGIIVILSTFVRELYVKNDTFPDYLASLLLLIFAIYYYLVKKLRTGKFETTSASEKYFRTLANMTLQPMILISENDQIVFKSESIKNILGISSNLNEGAMISDYIHPQDILKYKSFLKEVISWPNEKKHLELRFKKGDDNWIWVKFDAINLLKRSDVKSIVTSIQDITFQKNIDFQKTQLLENEKAARALAEKAIRDRDEFLSIASHELKTPLTTVLLQIQATLRKISTQSLSDFSGAELLHSLQIAEKQSQSLSGLIKDLLNVSLASTGRLSLNLERVNLADLAESLYKKYNEEIIESGCHVELVIENPKVYGNWDPVRLEQAMTNLLLNALKYARGKKVTLTCEKINNSGIFKVTDKGIGIKPENLEVIFEPFNRTSEKHSARGLGIGLFISKRIAMAHNGEIEVKSNYGKGTTFALVLPLEKETSLN